MRMQAHAWLVSLTAAAALSTACNESASKLQQDGSASVEPDASPRDSGNSDASSSAAGSGLMDSSAGDGSTPNEAGPQDAGGSDAQTTSIGSAKVFFFGHSLVDQDMPTMVGSLATARGKSYTTHGQLGWGTSLAAHLAWNGVLNGSAPAGFADENRAPFFAGEGEAQLATGGYDVLVLTESNGHTKTSAASNETVASALALINQARAANPNTRVFLYSNWLNRDEDFGGNLTAWQTKTDADLAWWESVADRVNAQLAGADIQLIPGGPTLVRVTRAIEQNRLPGLTVDDLFRENDGVHVNDRGFYVIALLHYAAIFRDTPVGLPVQTQTEDGPAEPLTAAQAATIQNLVWDYLKSYPRAGL